MDLRQLRIQRPTFSDSARNQRRTKKKNKKLDHVRNCVILFGIAALQLARIRSLLLVANTGGNAAHHFGSRWRPRYSKVNLLYRVLLPICTRGDTEARTRSAPIEPCNPI